LVEYLHFDIQESGADVFDRVKSWWFESVLNVNLRVGFEPIDAMVVVTHGLTMRFILMALYCWSPTTFHSVWNASNCDVYVLRRDLSKPGVSPYVLDTESGETPRSSINVMVELASTGETRTLKLENYLSIPPPRTTRLALVKSMLAQQYHGTLDPDDIVSIVFMPFVEGGVIKGRSTSGVASSHGGDRSFDDESEDGCGMCHDHHHHGDDDDDDDDSNTATKTDTSTTVNTSTGEFNRRCRMEVSGRFPCVKL